MGRLELIIGCMFASKTQQLQWRVNQERFRYGHTEETPCVELFKPTMDTRYTQENQVISHDGVALPCVVADDTRHILSYVHDHPTLRVLGIDEIQFFDGEIVSLVQTLLRDRPMHIIATGLNLDFRGEPFCFRDSKEHMGTLMALAHEIKSLHAICAYVDPAGDPDPKNRFGDPA